MNHFFILILSFYQMSFSAPERGQYIIFDKDGSKQLAVVGTKPNTSNGKTTVSASWYSSGKSFGKTSTTEKVDINSAGFQVETRELSVSPHGKALIVKKDSVILGADGKVYLVAAVFPSGDIGLHEIKKNSKTKLAASVDSIVKDKSFVQAVEQDCLGNVCKEAYVSSEDPSQLCSTQKMDYFKKNKVESPKADAPVCTRYKKPNAVPIARVFSSGHLQFLNGTVHPAFSPESPTHDADGTVGQ